MGLHQVIYTSCKRGIDGVNDGQQVYSYDKSFKDIGSDDVKRLFSYQTPSLRPGVLMTTEIALTMPQSFTYRKIDEGIYALALNTYLGLDYMGDSGRFGNYMSHVITFGDEYILNYPCEFYGSPSLRERMEYEEVNNPQRPDYLPTPTLQSGSMVNIDSITEFLGEDNRIEIYKNMLHAMLSFKSQRKRLVICDDTENIIMWIGALQYAVPLKNALNISFTTYEYDPSLSASQICGVVSEGTRFGEDSSRLHFVFNLQDNSWPELEYDESFSEFIDTAMSFSYESLEDFHRFLERGYSYEKADEDIYRAYSLYSLLSDGIGNSSIDMLTSSLKFASEYGRRDEIMRVVDEVMEHGEALNKLDREIFMHLSKFIVEHFHIIDSRRQEDFRALNVAFILRSLFDEEISENEFTDLYSEVEHLSNQCKFNIGAELIGEGDESKLFTLIDEGIENWKIAFIVKVISKYVRDGEFTADDLNIDTCIGRFYYELMKSVYSKKEEKGVYLATKTIDEFAFDSEYLVNMTLNIEGALLDFIQEDQVMTYLWEHFGRAMITHQGEHVDIAYRVFRDYNRYDQIFMLYTLQIEQDTGVQVLEEIFLEHFNISIKADQRYESEYALDVLGTYYESLKGFHRENTKRARIKLFALILEEKFDVDFSDELVEGLLSSIPLERPSKENLQFIEGAFKYTKDFRQRPIRGRLLLFYIGMTLESPYIGVDEKFKELNHIAVQGKVDMTGTTKEGANTYFDWILPIICQLWQETTDINFIYNIFKLSPDIKSIYLVKSAELYLKQGMNKNGYSAFCNYLDIVFKYSSTDIRKGVGEVVGKLSKSKLSDLDMKVDKIYSTDEIAKKYWGEILGTAVESKTLIKSISSFFRRG